MLRYRTLAAIIAIVILSLATWAQAESITETVTVAKTYNHAPFDYRIRLQNERPGFKIYRVTYPSPVTSPLPQNNTVPADYYVPRGIKQGDAGRPAVICLHILDGNEPLTDLMCSVLAARGVPAIAFKLPYYGARGTEKGPEALADDPKRFVGAVAQAGEDIRRTIDLLASRAEVNPERIGITGVSLGGIIAATAAGTEPRLHRAGLILSGGDLRTIIYHAHETRPLAIMLQKLSQQDRDEVEGKIAAMDPLRFAAGLRDRAKDGRVLMINAGDDEVIPHACTEKLADALGIADRVVWFAGLGHYTAMAELPRALRMTADFFARDLPPGVQPTVQESKAKTTPALCLATVLQQATTVLSTEPSPGRCHFLDLQLSATDAQRHAIDGGVRFIRGERGKFLLQGKLPEIGDVMLGQGRFPWLAGGGKAVLAGNKDLSKDCDPLRFFDQRNMTKLRVIAGLIGSVVMAPEMLGQWLTIEDEPLAIAAGKVEAASRRLPAAESGNKANNAAGCRVYNGRVLRIRAKDSKQLPIDVRLAFDEDGKTPTVATFAVDGVQGTLRFRGWQSNMPAADAMFEPPADRPIHEVNATDVVHVFGALLNFAVEHIGVGAWPTVDPKATAISLVARDPAGHGMLCRTQGKNILIVSGTPAQMGAAQGTLLRDSAKKLTERALYLVGGGETLRSGDWFLDRMAEIERRTMPHIPPRFIEECDALSKAAGVSTRDGRYANLFPERFHCSGVAMKGKATAGGRVLHARVLDYMREIDLQEAAVVQVFMPEGRNAWMSLGYAGFIGTVTAMNERGLAVGEMGGGGEGQWDGTPMSLLLRDLMERAGNVEEALAILRAAPRTCQYYYVLSDRSGTIRAVQCTPKEMTVLKPGQQDPRLPHVPDDVVLISGEDRAKLLAERIEANYGRIDVPSLINIIKRPVAMNSNLHNAIFAPETLDMWFADAGPNTPACDEPYARVNLKHLMEFYRQHP